MRQETVDSTTERRRARSTGGRGVMAKKKDKKKSKKKDKKSKKKSKK